MRFFRLARRRARRSRARWTADTVPGWVGGWRL